MTASITFGKEELKEFSVRLLLAAKCSPHDAEIVAESLVWADLRGRDEYGVSTRLPNLVQRLARGLIHSPAAMKWMPIAPAAQVLDAGHGFGQVAGRLAMDKAIDLSRNQGIGLVAVRQSNHFGAASYYCARATEAGCIGLTCTNAFPKVAPFGGRRPVLGTNPLAFGCPTDSGVPVLVDVSTAAYAGSSIRKTSAAGGQLPPEVALDANGQPTTEPSAAAGGCLLPAAGPKGFGLGLMVEILSGILTGAAMGQEVGSVFHTWDRPVNVGHLFVAIHIEHFTPTMVFDDRLKTLLGWVAECPRQHHAEAIRFPGELRGRYAALYERDGIPLDAGAVQHLNRLADEYQVRRLAENRSRAQAS
jgi:LDH2 family malate/lactate/ureidoglycolate dehydrogenase